MENKEGFKKRIISAMPLICLFIFLLLGFIGEELGEKWWHPAWVVFLLIPITPIILGIKKIQISYPVIVLFVYIIMGFLFPKYGWHPGWIIFLTIPIVNIIFPKPFFKKNNSKKKQKDEENFIDIEE